MALQTEGSLALSQTTADLRQPAIYLEQKQFLHTGSLSFASGEPKPLVTLSSNIEVGIDSGR